MPTDGVLSCRQVRSSAFPPLALLSSLVRLRTLSPPSALTLFLSFLSSLSFSRQTSRPASSRARFLDALGRGYSPVVPFGWHAVILLWPFCHKQHSRRGIAQLNGSIDNAKANPAFAPPRALFLPHSRTARSCCPLAVGRDVGGVLCVRWLFASLANNCPRWGEERRWRKKGGRKANCIRRTQAHTHAHF